MEPQLTVFYIENRLISKLNSSNFRVSIKPDCVCTLQESESPIDVACFAMVVDETDLA